MLYKIQKDTFFITMSKTPEGHSHSKPRQKRRDDFNLLNPLGRGAFGQVIEVEDKETKKHYAMKILPKSLILREKKMQYVKVERDVMTKLNHPNIVRLLLTFQDPGNLYYVIELAQHGDLQNTLNQLYSIDLPQSKIILGQILLAISHMHQRRILHRDLKPENVLLDDKNRVKITDFGTAKMFGQDEPFQTDRSSFVGSADYVSPEILNDTPVGPASDLWSYGCIVYTLLVGYPPFRTDSNYGTFLKIQAADYTLPDFLPEDAKDLIKKILVLKPEDRLGFDSFDNDYEPIRNHPFFQDINNWKDIPRQQIDQLMSYQPTIEDRDKKIAEKSSQTHLFDDNEDVQNENVVTFINPDGESKQVNLILTNKPRLLIVNLHKTRIKAEIPMVKDVKIQRVEPLKLEFSGPDVSFYIIFEKVEVADEWFSRISDLLENV